MKILEDYIAPVVSVDPADPGHTIRRTFGTAFFVNASGVFISARHVIENAQADVEANGGSWGLTMRGQTDEPFRVLGKVVNVVYADTPYDVAVGRADRGASACFILTESIKAWMWTQVHAAGYPETATKRLEDGLMISPRGFAGTILRTLPAGNRLSLHNPHPDVIEVSFPIPIGVSGGPLMIRGMPGSAAPVFALLGVCVGSERAEFTDHSISDVADDGTRFQERVVRVEQYGVVHDLRPLADWQPRILGNGLTLRELIRPDN